jgi:hypothetical protein
VLEHLRRVHGKVGLHGESGLEKIDGF